MNSSKPIARQDEPSTSATTPEPPQQPTAVADETATPREVALSNATLADVRDLLIRRAAEALLGAGSLTDIPAAHIREIGDIVKGRQESPTATAAADKARRADRVSKLIAAYGGNEEAASALSQQSAQRQAADRVKLPYDLPTDDGVSYGPDGTYQ